MGPPSTSQPALHDGGRATSPLALLYKSITVDSLQNRPLKPPFLGTAALLEPLGLTVREKPVDALRDLMFRNFATRSTSLLRVINDVIVLKRDSRCFYLCCKAAYGENSA